MKQVLVIIGFLTSIFLLTLFVFETKLNDIKNYFYSEIEKNLSGNDLDFVSVKLKGDDLKSSTIVELNGKVFDPEKKYIAENIIKKIDSFLNVDNKIKIVKKPIVERLAKNIISDVLEYPIENVKSDSINESKKNNEVNNNNESKKRTYTALECSRDISILLYENQINFKSNSIEFTNESYKVLNQLINIIKKCKNFKFDINGYTDSSGDKRKNLLLSGRRAEAVKNYLVKKGGFNPKRFRPIGFGAANPIADNNTVEGRAKNRRIEIVVIEE